MHHPLLFSWTGQPTEMNKLRWPGMTWGHLSEVPLLSEASTATVCLFLSFLSLLRSCPSSRSVPRLQSSFPQVPAVWHELHNAADTQWAGQCPNSEGQAARLDCLRSLDPSDITNYRIPTCCYSMYGIVNICVNPIVLGQLSESEAVKVSRSQKGNDLKIKSNHS